MKEHAIRRLFEIWQHVKKKLSGATIIFNTRLRQTDECNYQTIKMVSSISHESVVNIFKT
jgi:hypothetical protein